MDYGKIAYLKVNDLNRRVGNYFSNKSEIKTTKITVNKQLNSTNNAINYSFYVKNASDVNVEVVGFIFCESVNTISYSLLVDNVRAKTQTVLTVSNGYTPISISVDLKNIANVISIQLLFDLNVTINVNSTLNVLGENVSLFVSSPKMLLTKKGTDNIYANLTNNTLTLYLNGLSNILSTIDVDSISIDKALLYCFDNQLYLLFTSVGVLKICQIDLINNSLINVYSLFTGVSSFGATLFNGNIHVYAVVRNAIFHAIISLSNLSNVSFLQIQCSLPLRLSQIFVKNSVDTIYLGLKSSSNNNVVLLSSNDGVTFNSQIVPNNATLIDMATTNNDVLFLTLNNRVLSRFNLQNTTITNIVYADDALTDGTNYFVRVGNDYSII